MEPATRGRIVDLVLSPQPANPLCWSALAVAKDERAGEYVSTRGVATAFASVGCGTGRSADVVWTEPVRQSLARLRMLVARDCSVRAWMQFGRAPEVGERAIGDLRYGGATRDNFSTMQLPSADEALVCPAHLTHWGMPRADLLEAAPKRAGT
jgi:hypothetical protein